MGLHYETWEALADRLEDKFSLAKDTIYYVKDVFGPNNLRVKVDALYLQEDRFQKDITIPFWDFLNNSLELEVTEDEKEMFMEAQERSEERAYEKK